MIKLIYIFSTVIVQLVSHTRFTLVTAVTKSCSPGLILSRAGSEVAHGPPRSPRPSGPVWPGSCAPPAGARGGFAGATPPRCPATCARVLQRLDQWNCIHMCLCIIQSSATVFMQHLEQWNCIYTSFRTDFYRVTVFAMCNIATAFISVMAHYVN